MVRVSWSEDCESGRRQEQVAGIAKDDELDDEELHKCPEALRCGNSPGCDNVHVEAKSWVDGRDDGTIPHLPPHVAHRTHPSGARAWHVCKLHNKGPRDDYRNYREICLLCHSYKLMYAIVSQRLMTTLEGHLSDTETGFRPARGCRDNVCALRWFMQMILREGRQAGSIITFIDYSAAFDTESQMFLDEALAEAGVGAKVRRIVQAIFAAAIRVMRLTHPDGTMALSEPFDIARGVLQGIYSHPLHLSHDWIGSSGCMTSKTPALRLAWARVRPSCRSSSMRMTPRTSMRMLRQSDRTGGRLHH